ncbi:hypothetical protein SLA2020_324300 [Shorea laevis]
MADFTRKSPEISHPTGAAHGKGGRAAARVQAARAGSVQASRGASSRVGASNRGKCGGLASLGLQGREKRRRRADRANGWEEDAGNPRVAGKK